MDSNEYRFLLDERRNGRCDLDVCPRGILHVLCGLGMSFSWKETGFHELTDSWSLAELASAAPTAGGQYRACADYPTI